MFLEHWGLEGLLGRAVTVFADNHSLFGFGVPADLTVA